MACQEVDLPAERLSQLQRVHSESDLILTGSIGRSGIMGIDLPPVSNRTTSGLRDIDVFSPGGNWPLDKVGIDRLATPFPLDGYLHDWIKMNGANDTAFLTYPGSEHVSVEVPVNLLAPSKHEVADGVTVRTLDPVFQLYIDLMKGKPRRNDASIVATYRHHLHLHEALPSPEIVTLFAEHKRQILRHHPHHFPTMWLINSVLGLGSCP